MTENRAELILALRDEISKGLAPVNAALAQTKAQIADLGGGSKTAAAGLNDVAKSGAGVGDALAMAYGHAPMMVGQLAALAGVTVSVAGGLALVKTGIEEITSFNLKAISTAAMMLSRADVEGIEAQRAAYSGYKTYVLQMYEELEAETQNHFASGNEMIDSFSAFAKKGIYAAKEEAGAVGVITDAVKLLHGGYVDQTIMLHEIQGVLEGHAGMHFKLAQTLKGIIGPEWKEIVQSHIQDGTLLTFLQEKFKGLGVASDDIQKNLKAQETTFYTLISQVGRGGLGGLYEDIVGSAFQINEYLREHKDTLIVGIAQGWATVKWAVEKAADAAERFKAAASVEMPADQSKRTFRQQTMANFSEAFWGAPGNLATEVTAGISSAWDFASGGAQGWMVVIQEAYAQADKLDATHQNELKKTSDFLTNPEFWHWAIDFEGPKRELEDVKGKIQSVIDIISQPITWVINAVVSGLPAGLGGGPAAATAPAGALTIPDTGLAAAQEAARLKALGLTKMYLPGATVPSEVSYNPLVTTPPWSPPKPDTKGGKGSAEGALNSMQSLVDRLNQDIARLSEGSLAAVDAWYDKTMDDIAKLVAKGADGAGAEAAAWLAGGLKKDKIVDDFWVMVDKKTGEGYASIDDHYYQDLQKYGEIEGAKEALLAVWQKETFDLQQKYAKDIEDLRKTSLSTLASNVPLLTDQLSYERQIMEVEINRNRIALDKKIIDDHIPAAQAEELRGLNALADASRRYAQERKEWMTQGVSGGLQAYGVDRAKEAETRGAQSTIDAMKGAESWLGDTFGKSVYNSLLGQKDQLKQLFQNLMGDAMSWVFKTNAKTLFDAGAGLLPKQVGTAAVKISPVDAKINAQEVRNLALENRQFTSFGTEIQDFSRGIDKFGEYTRKGDTFYDKFGGQINQSFPELKQASAGLQSTVSPITDASGAQTAAAAESSLSSVAAVGAAVGMGVAAIGMLTGSKELSMAGMVISTAAAILQTAAMIMMVSSSVPFFHGGGIIYAHDGWPPLRHDERRIIGQVGEGILSREDMSYLGGPVRFNAFRRSLRSGGASDPAGSPGGGGDNRQVHFNFHEGAIQIPIQDSGMTQQQADQIVRQRILPAIEKAIGNRGLSLLG